MRILLNSPFPEYVYSNESTIKTNGEIEVDMTFTKQEIEDTLTYLEKFDPMYLSVNLENKLRTFGACAGSDIFFHLAKKHQVVKYVEKEFFPVVIPRLQVNRYVMDEVISFDDLDLFLFCLQHSDVEWTFVAESAIIRNATTIIEWLKENEPNSFRNNIIEAIQLNFELFKWIYERNWILPRRLDHYACHDLEVLKYLDRQDYPGWSMTTMDVAASLGRLDIVRWLHENRTEGCTTKAIDNALSHGHLETAMWIDENIGVGCTEDAIRHSIVRRDIDAIVWLITNYDISFDRIKEVAQRIGVQIGDSIDTVFMTDRQMPEA